MPSWSDGYVSDIAYTSNIYREQMPSWIGFATLLMGFGAPDIAEPFRVAELGCGYGLSLAVAASCSPQAEFWGFDFNPVHIE
ncbi:MAG TPA: class I SAM-dependent methyltransferase, partial [Acidisphaera sp.]|nr:class I SAM-dependent methyltransferase [Acidisphaera sp.]